MSKINQKLGQHTFDKFAILILMKKSNINIGSNIFMIILLQLGVRGFKEINKKFDAKQTMENYQLTNSPPPYFFNLAEKIKKQKLDKKNK